MKKKTNETKQSKFLKQKEEEFKGIMESYLNVKKESLELGFNGEKGIKFRDFLDIYLFDNKNFK